MERECKAQKHGVVKHYKSKEGYYRCSSCVIEGVTKRRRQKKLLAVEYLGGSCLICGYNKSVWALSFHHVRDKSFEIGDGNSRSWEKIKAELDKCVLLCHNCHAEYHAGLIDDSLLGTL